MDLKTVFELDDSDQKLESINISNHRKQITKAIAKLLSKMAEGIKMTLNPMDPIEGTTIKGKETLEDVITQESFKDYIKDFATDDLFKLIQAANYYADMKSLLSLAVLALCSRININKTEDEIRNIFNITKPDPKNLRQLQRTNSFKATESNRKQPKATESHLMKKK